MGIKFTYAPCYIAQSGELNVSGKRFPNSSEARDTGITKFGENFTGIKAFAPGETEYQDKKWTYCVSVAYRLTSKTWEEHFFRKEEDAKSYAQYVKSAGQVYLLVDRDGY